MPYRGLMNNFLTTTTSGIDSSQTTIDVASVTGVAAELALSDYVTMTLDDGTNIEIVHVTGVASLTLTVARAQEGTTGSAFSTGAKIQSRLTRQTILQRGEWEFVATQTLGSAVNNVVFDISKPFAHKIVLEQVLHGNTATLDLTVAIAGPTYQATNYQYTNRITDSNTASYGHTRSISATTILLCPDLSADVDRPINGNIVLYNKIAALPFYCDWDISNRISFGYIKKNHGSGMWNNATNLLVQAKLSISSGTFSIGSKFHLLRRSF